jgi:hypothetical protein
MSRGNLSLRSAAARNKPNRHLWMAEDRFANGSKTHVHGERDLAPSAPGSSLDFGNGYLGHVPEPNARARSCCLKVQGPRFLFLGSARVMTLTSASSLACSSSVLHCKLIVDVLHSRRCDNILATIPCLRGCKFLFVSPESRYSRIAFAPDPCQDFVESGIIGRKKEGSTEIDASRDRLRAETPNYVADVDGEKTNHLRCAPEVLSYFIHCAICNQKLFWTLFRDIPVDFTDGQEKILAWVSLGIADGVCPLMEVTSDDRGRSFATERGREPKVYRHRYAIEIQIPSRRRWHRRPERKSDVPVVLQLVERPAC